MLRTTLIILTTSLTVAQPIDLKANGDTGQQINQTEFRKRLSALLKKQKRTLYYKTARLYLFNNIYAYNKNGSENKYLKDLYCGKEYENNVDIHLDQENLPDGNIINTEHTWPKSRFFEYGDSVEHGKNEYDDMVADMHHLFPTDSFVNSMRASYHYGEVDENKLQDCGQSKFGKNKKYPTMPLFEPPNEVKGDIARGLFYFAVTYELPINDREEEFLRAWDKLDPVSEFEKFRNDEVEKYQGNRNPFIDYPELIDLLTDL
ncbi:nuclease, EndA/NucM family [Bacteriovorax sp. BAL6_X]|uniref:endonuclease I family protein n=1 Tax=Bacteriovorax sp. BAL6_X TaxID=1201290 RepID=UPI0003861E7A|nr:endonuclease [Bacteriovorax sp. BAL6_X]EPZ51072.1 nuclease, EndA/NucM family [Bacteriovorax sp. BAL6_X]